MDARATYTYSGQSYAVHETWLHYSVDHFDPVPAQLTAYEEESIVGFRWWTAEELRTTHESMYPPDLGDHFTDLHTTGNPLAPIDIGCGAFPR